MKRNRILAVLLAALLILGALAGCAASMKSKSAATADYAQADLTAAPEAANDGEMSASAGAMAADEKLATTAASSADASASSSEQPTEDPTGDTQDYAAKIIYSGNVTLQSTEFDKALAALEKSVQDAGGFIESSNVSGNTQYREDGTTEVVDRVAYYTVRVPAEKFDGYMKTVGGIGNVIASGRSAENVTSTYTDNEAHLDSLQTEQTRLLDLVKKAEDVESLVALEQRLSEVRYEIESIQRTLRDLDLQIAYSSVTVELDEVEVYTPTASVTRSFGEKLASALKDGWNGFVYGLQTFAVWFVGALPTLVLLAVAAAAVVLIVRAARKKSRARREKKAAEQPAEKPEEKK